mmetsp:Transcript_25660/g.64653  ORF Transcript_25660/g.64653 Transcript_25660/m.64653 type:complete len:90 (-) Transcript_25660:391-660(-)
MAVDVQAQAGAELQATTVGSSGSGGQLRTYVPEQAQQAAENEEEAAPLDQQQPIPAQAQAPDEEALRLSSSTVGASLLDFDGMSPPLDQ